MRDTESLPFSSGDVVLVKTIRELPSLSANKKGPNVIVSIPVAVKVVVWTPGSNTPGSRSGTSHRPLLRRIQQACPQNMLM